MQHSVEGNPRDRSDGNALARDSGFSPERFANSSRSFSVKSENHSGPKTKVQFVYSNYANAVKIFFGRVSL